ncbi:MAG: DUF3604 domain-containing protein [Gemmatimonadetes bacterium]|nr:DUF3604 domain-containing protein [Gemmatimonadota bacterium]MBT6143913.1 DUF3604 domain-containing protein [Gemmatimonadota bacterium]MBT7859885.1 DUF3604 domain-containing protein [Gemmatimonadota bacterium]
MARDEREMVGWVELTPQDPVVAGSTGSFQLTYHVGEYGIDDGGTIKISVRFASDWGKPQFDDPKGLNYTTVRTDGPGRLQARFDPKGFIRPWQKCLVIDNAEWALSKGDTITVVYGDRSQGSAGTVAQTFREYSFEFRVAVDAFGTGQFIVLDEQPALEIVPAAAAKLVVIGPTRVAVGEQFALGVKVEDAWGNPAVAHNGMARLDIPAGVEGLPEQVDFSGQEGVVRIEGGRCTVPDTFSILATAPGLERGESPPLECVEDLGTHRPFWGDLHGQSEETVGTNSVEDYFRFARDVSLVDFTGHQGNDFQITPEFWERIGRCARDFDTPGRFVVFPGYEWSATTPAGGDRNVHYLEDGQPIHRTSHWQVAGDEAGLVEDRYPVGELFEQLKQGRPALVVPHIGGRPANLAFHDPELEPVIEIYSAWGQFEWLLEEAITRGYQVGFSGGSDDHKGRPGASYPGSSSFGVYGGLTCVFATQLTRAGIWEALKARRCYATSGQRIALDVHTTDGQGAERCMGEAFETTASSLSVHVEATGTADIEEVLIVRGRPGSGTETVGRYPAEMARDRRRLRVVWSGARIKGRDRIATWDGELRLHGVELTGAEGYAFDSASEGIRAQSVSHVAWESVTSGDEDGVILDLAGDADGAKLEFSSSICSFQLDLDELSAGPFIQEAGGEGLQVCVEYLPAGVGSRHVRFDADVELPVCDTSTAVYIRLTQVDGARAWSSPFYVRRLGDTG